MHWETNGHLGGMPLQLYHLVTPGGHKRRRDDCMRPCGRAAFDTGKRFTFEKTKQENARVFFFGATRDFRRVNNSCCQRRRGGSKSHTLSLSHRGRPLETCSVTFRLFKECSFHFRLKSHRKIFLFYYFSKDTMTLGWWIVWFSAGLMIENKLYCKLLTFAENQSKWVFSPEWRKYAYFFLPILF